MESNTGQAKMRSAKRHADGFTATRWAVNHNWNRRDDNTKYKETK